MPTTRDGLNVIINIAIKQNQKTEWLKEKCNAQQNTPVLKSYINETLKKVPLRKICSKQTVLSAASYSLFW